MPDNMVLLDQNLQKQRLQGAIDYDQSLEKQRLEAAQSTQQLGMPNNQVDIMVVVFYLLMSAASTTAQGAVLNSKMLASNAGAQQQLNGQGEKLQWYYVPKLKEAPAQYTVIAHKHWTLAFWKHGFFEYTTAQIVKLPTVFLNATAVNNAQAQNQQVSAIRQTIADQLSLLQQNAQVGETSVNTMTDQSMQAMQMGINILQILQALTFQALLRQQPQT